MPAQRARFLEQARRQLDATREDMGEKFGPEFAAVFHTHIQILEDKGFVNRLREAVREGRNAVEALRSVLAVYRKSFERIADPYFRERAWDVEDVGRRRCRRTSGRSGPAWRAGATSRSRTATS